MQWFTEIAEPLTAVAGVIIAILLYRLSRQQRKDEWLRTLAAIHKTFWEDPDIRDIRYCIAYDAAYVALGEALAHRKALHEERTTEPLLESQYVLLDKLDKFLNLIGRVIGTSLDYRRRRRPHIWRKLIFSYWIEQCISSERTEFVWYVQHFYQGLSDAAQQYQQTIKKSDV